MNGRNPHQALKSDIIGQARASRAEVVLARLQWGKEDIGFSLHINPNTYSTSGIQITDFLSYLDFRRSGCSFTTGRQCYVRWVDEGFDLSSFVASFDSSFAKLEDAEHDLEACGFFLNQPEGWGYFHGRQSGVSRRGADRMGGDGHTAMSVKQLKQSTDDIFDYRFTWLESDRVQGWVTHYRPKHPPLSSELRSVFKFLGLETFRECPEFEFEECSWRSLAYVSRGDGFFDNNTEWAHRGFDAHAARFAPGIQKLLTANSEIEKFGMSFLPFDKPAARLAIDIEQLVARPAKASKLRTDAHFDVAISFAGPERKQAEQLATALKEAGFSVFYDEFFPEYLWGKNLVDTFDEIYRKLARFCVIFVSKDYNERVWTNHERQSAQARALTEKGKEYILPIKVDETELKGMPPTLGYMPLSRGIDKIGELLIKKLRS